MTVRRYVDTSIEVIDSVGLPLRTIGLAPRRHDVLVDDGFQTFDKAGQAILLYLDFVGRIRPFGSNASGASHDPRSAGSPDAQGASFREAR